MKQLLSIIVLLALVSSVFACRSNDMPACVRDNGDTCARYTSIEDIQSALISNSVSNGTASWEHNVVLSDSYSSYTLTGATLTISANSDWRDFFETDEVEITFMGVSLGSLNSSTWFCNLGNMTTTFNLADYYVDENTSLLDLMSAYISSNLPLAATAELVYEKNGRCDSSDKVYLFESILNLQLCQSTPDNGSGNNAVVPAPGAVLLSGFGTALVGFVRRRSL